MQLAIRPFEHYDILFLIFPEIIDTIHYGFVESNLNQMNKPNLKDLPYVLILDLEEIVVYLQTSNLN